MNTFRTTARLTLAALSVGLGATLAPAADHKPIKPVAPPATKVQGHTTGKPVIEEMKFPAASKPHAPVNSAAKKPGSGITHEDSWNLRGVKSAREAGSGLATGRTKPANLGDTGTHEVGHVKGPKVNPKNAKPVNTGGGVAVQNDAGTRSGAGLAFEGVWQMASGVTKLLRGKTHDGVKTIDDGARKFQAGVDGDPANNGDKLQDEGKENGGSSGENSNGEGSSGGEGSGSGNGGSAGSGK